MSEITLEEIQEYQDIKEQLKRIKALEMEMRMDLVNRMRETDDHYVNGDCNKLRYEDHNFVIKAKIGRNFKHDEKARAALWDSLSDEEKACFKPPKVELHDTKFKAFQEEHEEEVSALWDIVTEKEGAPTVEIEIFD